MTPPNPYNGTTLHRTLFPKFVVRPGKWFRQTVFPALWQLSRALPSPGRNATALWKIPREKISKDEERRSLGVDLVEIPVRVGSAQSLARRPSKLRRLSVSAAWSACAGIAPSTAPRARIAAIRSMRGRGPVPAVGSAAEGRVLKPEVIAARFGSGRSGSGQGEGQEARAQQHDARCGQRQESAGNCILVAHETPAPRDAGSN